MGTPAWGASSRGHLTAVSHVVVSNIQLEVQLSCLLYVQHPCAAATWWLPPTHSCAVWLLQYFTSFKHISSEFERQAMIEKFAKLNSKLQQVRGDQQAWQGHKGKQQLGCAW